jgi:acetyl-CoA carboxylase carboxyltransferase component
MDRSPALSLRAGTLGAVTVRADELGGRPVVVAEIGPSSMLGALNLADGEKLAAAVRTAHQSRRPFIAYLSSSGALVAEGLAASHGWGLAARALVQASGTIPLLFAVHGPAVSGMALVLGLADHVVMTDDAYAFVTGPRIVRAVTGVGVSARNLGGTGTHVRHTGVASLVAADLDGATDLLEHLLTFLPSHADELPARVLTDDPPNRPTPEAGDLLPASPNASYDVRQVARVLADDGELLELRGGWASNLVTALASIGGHPIGIVANQPMSIAGTLDIPASQKGAGFVAFCDAFNLPIVTLVDTPGFYPGKDLEWRGMIRHGAQLAFAYARATVPRISVTLRKSYGGAYIVMDSKTMGSDLALAWPMAEIAVMGAKGAVQILHRRASEDEQLQREAEYEERLLNPYVAADRGLVDAVIDPVEARRELAAALDVFAAKREQLVGRFHDNTPL